MKNNSIIFATLIIYSAGMLFIVKPVSAKEKNVSAAIDYREEMRKFVMLISKRAKKIKPEFAVVPQNALDLVTLNGETGGNPARSYLSAIDATGCEELFYGLSGDGRKTAKSETDYFQGYLQIMKKHGKAVLVIDYVINKKQADESFRLNNKHGYISFQTNRALTIIPPWIHNKNDNVVTRIHKARNFIYLVNASAFRTPDSFIGAVSKTAYDLMVVDLFFHDKMLDKKQVVLLQKKPSGKRRMVLAYMSVGEAEDYRYYWKTEWNRKKPPFLERENPQWKGNYKVKYWMDEWKEIIAGRVDGTGFEKSYLKKIIDTGFDGVYLDVIDAAHYFEEKTK